MKESGSGCRHYHCSADVSANAIQVHHLADELFDPVRLEQIVAETERPLVSNVSREKAEGVLPDFYGGEYHERARRGRIEARDMPVFLSWRGKAWSGVMDLVLSENGAVTGVDYKIMKKPKQLPGKYEQQQQVYTGALQRIFPKRKISFEFWRLA